MIDNLISGIAADIKGAVAGGVVACILDRGTFFRRIFNGVGSIVISMACTNGILDIAGDMLPKTDNVVMLFASIFAIVGIVVAEILQRTMRRVLGRTDDAVDQALEKFAGVKNDDK